MLASTLLFIIIIIIINMPNGMKTSKEYEGQ